MGKLTATGIKNEKPREDGKPRKVHDGDGLYLLIKPASKAWRYRYQLAGRERHMGLGLFPALGLAEARSLRNEYKALARQGVDPIDKRKADEVSLSLAREAERLELERKKATFAKVCDDWLALRKEEWTEKVWARTHSRMIRLVYPHIGNRPIAGISSDDCLSVMEAIKAGGAAYSAHKILTYMNRVFAFAVVKGKTYGISVNPIINLNKDTKGAAPVAKNRAALAGESQRGRLAEVLQLLDGHTGATPQVYAASRLAPLVFVRPGELRTMKWEDINYIVHPKTDYQEKVKGWEWTYLSTKMNKIHTVPLAPQAILILDELRKYTGDGVYCFPNPVTKGRSRSPVMSENGLLNGLRDVGVTQEEHTPHGWRAVARTQLDEVLGVRDDLIRHQLSHMVKDDTGTAYNRTKFIRERHKMMRDWADYLDRLKGVANVVDFQVRKAAVEN